MYEIPVYLAPANPALTGTRSATDLCDKRHTMSRDYMIQ